MANPIAPYHVCNLFAGCPTTQLAQPGVQACPPLCSAPTLYGRTPLTQCACHLGRLAFHPHPAAKSAKPGTHLWLLAHRPLQLPERRRLATVRLNKLLHQGCRGGECPARACWQTWHVSASRRAQEQRQLQGKGPLKRGRAAQPAALEQCPLQACSQRTAGCRGDAAESQALLTTNSDPHKNNTHHAHTTRHHITPCHITGHTPCVSASGVVALTSAPQRGQSWKRWMQPAQKRWPQHVVAQSWKRDLRSAEGRE